VKLLQTATALLAGLVSLALTVGQATAADASGDDRGPILGAFYVRGDAGWSFLEWDGEEDDGGVTAGLGVGYQWYEYLRTDARLDWSGPFDTGAVDLEATTLLGNAYIDIPLTDDITPYVGAGLGWGWVDGDGGGDDSGLAYSLMVGSAFTLTGRVELDAGYRYRGITIDGDDATDHSVTGGIRFKF
jgi:opacity protein-like surface antigen